MDIVQETGIKTIPKKRKCKEAKWLSEEVLQIAVKRRKVKVKSLSCAQLLATLWTAAYQAPASMGFFRQEYCSGVLLPSPRPFQYDLSQIPHSGSEK